MLMRHMDNRSKRGFQARELTQNQASRGMGDDDDEALVVVRHRMQLDDGFSSSAIKRAGRCYYQYYPFHPYSFDKLAKILSCAAPVAAKGHQS